MRTPQTGRKFKNTCEHEAEQEEQEEQEDDTPITSYGSMALLDRDITQKSATDFMILCASIIAEDPEKPLVVGVNSIGGCFKSSMMVVDFLHSLKTPTVAFNMGIAYSGAALIYLACKERNAFPSSQFMIHEVYVLNMSGNYQELKDFTEDVKRMNSLADNFICKQTHITPKLLKDKYKEEKDWYLSAKESLKMGISTKISGDLMQYLLPTEE